ncbi:nickel import ATP-binding protein NikD [Methanosarcina sp.]|uniref:nickel import ATP-binding protein NikD n=1 Tax=Methanosarcina sp. TaxID=2213 RepID=UPI00298954B0|nr:nickel import ATP-binding protein NikD [Methanosarcina sp.]MDW5549400.1 nickel import ATP-binding protein NikD [Methanosarcina sp.]MDW5553409.1 nickel import ATP-binding protein NikD [Methanosarcina sp.]MDW5559733.1 nickel import ATP-binding protein NikD [Methanosarcina sp.]
MQYKTNQGVQSENKALEIRSLSLDYIMPDQSIHAVVDLNLVARTGKITALVGESGSGKSTVALAVMGIQDKNAVISNGEIYLAGTDILSMPKKGLRSYISNHSGIIFQDPIDSLNPLLTVGEQLVEAVLIHEKITKKQAFTIALNQLLAVSLPQPEELMKKYPFMLSGGMCQRVMIAIASVFRPSLLIADEPTTALDVTVQAQILHQLDSMRKRDGTAILLITHDLGVVAEIADDVCVMKDGYIVESGTVEDIFSNPQHRYTRQLLAAAL